MEPVNQHSVLYIHDMCCADEQSIIEKKLRTLSGVKQYTFNLIARKLFVTHSLSTESIITSLKEVGFSAKSFSTRAQPPQSFLVRYSTSIITLFAACSTLAGVVLSQVGGHSESAILLFILAIVVGGWKVAVKGWKAASILSLDMNALMSVAVIGAMAIGKWEEGAAVIVLFALAQLLEEVSMRRTRKSLSSLINLAPSTATVRQNSGEVRLTLDEVNVGDTVVIRPGEKIPVDGIVVAGRSFVNHAAITGESAAAEKKNGDTVFAGTMNEQGSLEIRTTKIGEDTTLGHIVHLVEEAQTQRSPAQDFVDRFAKIYTPAVLGIALLVVLVPPLILGQSFGIWFYRSLVLLVIACPCALVISTPVTIVSGLTAAARLGILVKGGRSLEEASKLKAILFDKTGTLTHGVSMVTDILQLNSISTEKILRIAALGEMKSEHPHAQAIVSKAREQHIDLEASVDRFESIAGRGILVSIDGQQYIIGSHMLIEERGLCSVEVESALNVLEAQGKTTILVCSHQKVLGVIGVADTIRAESNSTIQFLRQKGIQEIVLLSGDSNTAAHSIASRLGIDTYFGQLLPSDKVAVVKEMKAKYGSVAMVGDGVNDAPALAASSLGIAMGETGTDVALETADVVLMKDDLSRITSLISIGKKTMSVLRQNVVLALLLKAVFLLLAIFGVATLWMAVIADDGVTLLVVLNSLRLLRKN